MEIVTSGVVANTDPKALGAALCSLLGIAEATATAEKDNNSPWPSMGLVPETDVLEKQLEHLQRGGSDPAVACPLDMPACSQAT